MSRERETLLAIIKREKEDKEKILRQIAGDRMAQSERQVRAVSATFHGEFGKGTVGQSTANPSCLPCCMAALAVASVPLVRPLSKMPVKKSIAGEVDCETIDEEVNPLGLSLEGIKQLLLDVYPQIKVKDLTTGDMNEAIIKPATKGTKKSFTRNQVGIRGKSGRYVVQPATVFISHAWNYKFLKVIINVFEQYEKKNRWLSNTYFWFCLFNNDQHEAGNNDYDFFATVFRRSLTSIGKVLVVMSPWNDPTREP